MPTLVLHGSEDALVPVSNAERLAAGIPGAELRIVRGGGHLVVLDAVTGVQDLRQWLSGLARSQPEPAGHAGNGWAVVTDPWRLVAAQTLPMQRLLTGRTRLF